LICLCAWLTLRLVATLGPLGISTVFTAENRYWLAGSHREGTKTSRSGLKLK